MPDGFIIVMTPPSGVKEYMPDGFGHTAHAHVTDRAEAKVHATKEQALSTLQHYRHPLGFWESERRHQQLIEAKFRGWKFEIEAL